MPDRSFASARRRIDARFTLSDRGLLTANVLYRENLFEDATAAVTVDGSLGNSTMVSQPISATGNRNARRAFVQTLGSGLARLLASVAD